MFQWPTAAAPPSAATLTYLEINGWLLSAAGCTVLIDPVLEGSLDFGIPDIYCAAKRVLPRQGLIDTLPPLDALLITQGLDDHAHARTLAKLATRDPGLPIIAAPSAEPVVQAHFRKQGVRYIASRSRRIDLPYLGLDALPTLWLPSSSDPDCATIKPRRGGRGGLRVQATSGALVGPPWQRRENGYIIQPLESKAAPSIYLEPHVEYDTRELAARAPVDAVITPTSGQGLPGFELVHGPGAAVELVRALRPRWVVPMRNGAVDADGLAAPLVEEIGSGSEFAEALCAAVPRTEIVDVRAGEPVTLSLS